MKRSRKAETISSIMTMVRECNASDGPWLKDVLTAAMTGVSELPGELDEDEEKMCANLNHLTIAIYNGRYDEIDKL